MKWGNLTQETREVMKDLGNYSPTTDGLTVKGYIGEYQEGQSYLDSKELRCMAKAFIEVADFLDTKEVVR
jgi:hypothetical protein